MIDEKMNINQRIDEFNKMNKPFYIVAHNNGDYSLCFPIALMPYRYTDLGQYAFNKYAESIGEPAVIKNMYTHGNGYEWEAVFKKFFKDDPRIANIKFDCESGGFFCYAKDLDLIDELGKRFREICNNEEVFTELVCSALAEYSISNDEKERLDDEYNEIFINALKNELLKRGLTLEDEMIEPEVMPNTNEENNCGQKMK